MHGGAALGSCVLQLLISAIFQEGVSLGWLKRAMHYAFTQTDREVRTARSELRCLPHLSEQWYFLQVLLAGINDGTTGVCLAVSSSHLLVSNCGDSRAVLWDQADGGVDFALSLDHKPSRRAEKRRIEALGGRITYFGVPRVNGVLAVSRAIGDSAYKRFIISDPEQRSRKAARLSSIIADQPRTLHAKVLCPILSFGSLARNQQTCFSLDEIICSR